MNNSSCNIYLRSKKSFPLRYLEIISSARDIGRGGSFAVYVFVLGAEKDAIFLSEKKGGEGRARKKLEAEVDVLFQTSLFP
jgi:hypothetical protein